MGAGAEIWRAPAMLSPCATRKASIQAESLWTRGRGKKSRYLMQQRHSSVKIETTSKIRVCLPPRSPMSSNRFQASQQNNKKWCLIILFTTLVAATNFSSLASGSTQEQQRQSFATTRGQQQWPSTGQPTEVSRSQSDTALNANSTALGHSNATLFNYEQLQLPKKVLATISRRQDSGALADGSLEGTQSQLAPRSVNAENLVLLANQVSEKSASPSTENSSNSVEPLVASASKKKKKMVKKKKKKMEKKHKEWKKGKKHKKVTVDCGQLVA